jgi:hypothetical protein
VAYPKESIFFPHEKFGDCSNEPAITWRQERGGISEIKKPCRELSVVCLLLLRAWDKIRKGHGMNLGIAELETHAAGRSGRENSTHACSHL